MGLFCYRYFVPNGTESGLFGLLNLRPLWLKSMNDSGSGEAGMGKFLKNSLTDRLLNEYIQ